MALIGFRHVVVDHNVDALDVDATAHQVSGHQDALLALLELLVHLWHGRSGASADRPTGVHMAPALAVDADGGGCVAAEWTTRKHGALVRR